MINREAVVTPAAPVAPVVPVTPVTPVTATTALLIVSLLFVGCAPKRVQVTPRAPAADWGSVENLTTGQLVEIESHQGVQIIGKVSQATASELHVVGESGGTSVARRADVRQIVVIVEGKSDSLRNGALVGAIIGVGYATGVLVYLAGGDDGQGGGRAVASVLAGAAIGGGMGALVDKARSRRLTQVIYRASKPSGTGIEPCDDGAWPIAPSGAE